MTTGQSIVATWEAPDSPWSEPADLAEAIDKAIAAEREACAKIAEARAKDAEHGTWQAQEGLLIAADIRARSTK